MNSFRSDMIMFEHHQLRLVSWPSYSKATTLRSTGNIISRSKALLWVPKWHLHTPTFSWVYSRDSCWGQWLWDHFHGYGLLAILTWSGPTAARLWQLSPTRPITSTEHKVHSWNFKEAAHVSGHEIKSCGRYNICWSLHKTNRYTPVSLTHVATQIVAAKTLLYAWHFASDVSARIRTLLNQEQENRLTTSANSVIRNRQFYLLLR